MADTNERERLVKIRRYYELHGELPDEMDSIWLIMQAEKLLEPSDPPADAALADVSDSVLLKAYTTASGGEVLSHSWRPIFLRYARIGIAAALRARTVPDAMTDMPLHKTEEGEEIDRLRAELSEARRMLDEARKQEPVAWLAWCQRRCPVGVTTTDASVADHYRANGYAVVDLYRAAPVPAQHAVPDGWMTIMVPKFVWRRIEQAHSEATQPHHGMCVGNPYVKVDASDIQAFRRYPDAAILSATETEGRKDGKG